MTELRLLIGETKRHAEGRGLIPRPVPITFPRIELHAYKVINQHLLLHDSYMMEKNTNSSTISRLVLADHELRGAPVKYVVLSFIEENLLLTVV